MDEAFVRYLHFFGIILFSSGLMVEVFLISEKVTAEQFRKIARADAMCGMSIILIMISGLLLWFVVGKPSEFYSMNLLFYLKMTTLLCMIMLAIKPAIYFIRNRSRTDEMIEIPGRILLQLRIELVLLLFMPLLAVFMARGYGVG